MPIYVILKLCMIYNFLYVISYADEKYIRQLKSNYTYSSYLSEDRAKKMNGDKFKIKFKVILKCKRTGDVSGNCCYLTKFYGNWSEDMQSHEKVINKVIILNLTLEAF